MNDIETIIPTRLVGPIKIIADDFISAVRVPLATFETPLWPSVDRGARVSRLTDGIKVSVLRNCMTRSILLEAPDAQYIGFIQRELDLKRLQMEQVVETTSSFAKLQNWQTQAVGNLLYLRFSFNTFDASGHNMATKAAEALVKWLLHQYPNLCYVSLSGNLCVDKKVSAINGILGRGKYVVAEINIDRDICREQLHTTPEKIATLNVKKNLIGSILAGSICSANAHFANMLLALYLATGQDAANIVEGSQGIVHAEVKEDKLYFSATLPNIIVGTVGKSKDVPFIKSNLEKLGCLEEREAGKNAERLAVIAAATVLCGELSLLSALTNQDELMRSHLRLERRSK